MTVDEFVEKAKTELDSFSKVVKEKDSPLKPDVTPPLAEGVPEGELGDFDIWWEEFTGWLDAVAGIL